MIKANAHKYSVSAMCKVLQIPKSTYYYKSKGRKNVPEIQKNIVDIFMENRNNYGTRKIKKELAKLGIIASRRRIGKVMKENGLVSNYTVAKFRPHKTSCNESKVANVVNRKFNSQSYRNVVVSDLTYVRVGQNWHYICILVDLFNREIIGYSAGPNKTALLVKQAFQTVKGNLAGINIFHTDRGLEFKNGLIEEILETFDIQRSLSHKGCPYDNAVAESTFKLVKTEFVRNQTFKNIYQLQIELSDYVNWFNNRRIHSSLGYLTPVEYRMKLLKKIV